MIEILTALAPVIILIGVGKILAAIRFLDDIGWSVIDRVAYYVFFPTLLFSDLATADLQAGEAVPLALALVSAQSVMAFALLALRSKLALGGPEFSSVFQGAVRWNSFVALALAANLHGVDGVALVAVGLAVMVPMANVFSVYVLARYAQGRNIDLRATIGMLSRNPLLIACLAGLASHAFPPLPGVVIKATQILGSATLPLGLLSAGAGLDLNAGFGSTRVVIWASVLKLVAMPVLVFLGCFVFGVHGMAREMAVLCGAVPGATMSYVLARQMNGHAPMIASIITATTLGAAVSLPIALALLRLL